MAETVIVGLMPVGFNYLAKTFGAFYDARAAWTANHAPVKGFGIGL